MTRFYEAPWAPSTSPQSSHSAHQHPQQRFSPHHAPLMWDRAKPCNTKRFGIIHMFAPSTHSLTGREQFFTRTLTNFHCGRFVRMSRENSRSGSFRPSSLTYAQLGVFSSPEEKIIQRETRENKRKIPVLRVLCLNFYTLQFDDFVCMCRGFSFSRNPIVWYDHILFWHTCCIQCSDFKIYIIKLFY